MCEIKFGVRIDDEVFEVTQGIFNSVSYLYDSAVLLRHPKTGNMTIVGEIFTERDKKDGIK